ncbi:MAG: S9 family peptidase [Fimbriimonadaceae bacterium]
MPKRPVEPEDLLRFILVSEPQVSPDGSRVLFVRKQMGPKNRLESSLWTVDTDTRRERPWTGPKGGASHPRWSPDGTRIAFVSEREEPGPQIFVLPLAGGEALRVGNLEEGSIGGFQWSPDGTKIAFTFRPEDPDWTKQAREARKESGHSDPPRATESPMYKLDGDGFFMERRYALYVLDLETGAHALVDDRCPAGAYSFAWAPDSVRLAFTRRVAENLWADPADVRIDVWDGTLLEGRAPRVSKREIQGSAGGDKHTLAWSPDGTRIAYLGNDDPDDHRGVRNTRLFTIPASGGSPTCLTDSDDVDLANGTLADTGEIGNTIVLWSPDSRRILVSVAHRGETQLGTVDAERGGLGLLTSGPHTLTLGNLSADGRRMGIVFSDWSHPVEVGFLEVGSDAATPTVLTRHNADLMAELDLAEVEEHWVDSTDGVRVHTWVVRPPKTALDESLPAVLEIHGGPHAQYGWSYFHEFQCLAAAGYVVVFSNPRGSKGYGESWVRAIAGHWGGKDWEDIRSVKDWMKTLPFVDPGRLGVMGGSYGGYLVNWTVGHTEDFRAAITDRCVSNLVSKSLNSDYPYFPGKYWKGRPYGDLEAIADLWRDSPIAYFDRVQTPMLIIHSEGDLRCHIEQGEQVFTALRERGVPARFVRYPASTSHGMSRSGPPDLRIHRLNEILTWWERWLA